MTSTTRETLRDTANHHGWAIDQAHDLTDRFDRGDFTVHVRFSRAGGILVAARRGPYDRYLTEIPGKGKAAKVTAILTAWHRVPQANQPTGCEDGCYGPGCPRYRSPGDCHVCGHDSIATDGIRFACTAHAPESIWH